MRTAVSPPYRTPSNFRVGAILLMKNDLTRFTPDDGCADRKITRGRNDDFSCNANFTNGERTNGNFNARASQRVYFELATFASEI